MKGNCTACVPDMLAVINAWGACPNGTFCYADLDNDGSVGTPDLLAVINAWGACPGEESFMEGPEPPPWIDDIIDILNDPELSEEEQVELIAAILAEQE